MKGSRIALITMTVSLLAISSTAQAKIIITDHVINKVTVYPRDAQVTRQASLQLTTGNHVLVLDNLPASLRQNSIRVSGQGTASVVFGSIESKQIPTGTLVQTQEKQLNDKIIKLNDDNLMLQNNIESLNLRLAFIKNLGQNIPETINKEIKVGILKPTMWREAWESIGNGASDTFKKIVANDQKRRLISEKLTKLRNQLHQIQTGNRSVSQARVNIKVLQAGKFVLELSYQITGATWQAVYDARLDVENNTLQLTQYGQIRQRTGEDWRNVQLRLSTSNPSLGVAMPDLEPWFIHSKAPVEIKRRTQHENYDELSQQSPDDSDVQYMAAPRSLAKAADFKYANQIVSEFAAEFEISGRSTILADNSPQKFAITENNLTPTLAARVVPKKESKAYLYAEAKYTGQVPLLAGQVSVFRDNSYVGNLNMDLVRPAETIKLSFGVDERIKVDYRLVTNDQSEHGFLSSDKIVNRLYKVDIVNFHSKPFTITLLEQIPVSQDDKIQIELSDNTTPPSSKDLDSRLGVMAWEYLYQPNGKKEITIGYQIRYPKELVILGL